MPSGRARPHLGNRHIFVFLANSGPQPWPCWGCGGPVTLDTLAVHHLNEDHDDNAVANLVPMHRGCHTTHHHTGRKHGPEARRKIREARARQVFTPETRRKLSEASRGRRLSEESRQKIRAAKTGRPNRQRRFRCGGCNHVSTGAGLRQHQLGNGHTGRVETGVVA